MICECNITGNKEAFLFILKSQCCLLITLICIFGDFFDLESSA